LADVDPRSNEALVDAANRGDVKAFEAIYFRHRAWVASLAFRFTANRDDALDVLQDTFAYLLRKFPGFRLTAGMKTFLYPVVKNLSIAARRNSRRLLLDSDALDTITVPEEPLPAGRSELAAALSILPGIHREVLLMRFVDAMTLDEMAVALGIPVGTVKSRLHDALATLREDERTRGYFER
jgi:RNA polymerase sigma-70 factor (ECF subfamily)